MDLYESYKRGEYHDPECCKTSPTQSLQVLVALQNRLPVVDEKRASTLSNSSHGQQSPQEFYITISKTYVPTLIKMRQASNWTTIRISNFRQQEHNVGLFSFQSKDFPKAEIIDLR